MSQSTCAQVLLVSQGQSGGGWGSPRTMCG